MALSITQCLRVLKQILQTTVNIRHEVRLLRVNHLRRLGQSENVFIDISVALRSFINISVLLDFRVNVSAQVEHVVAMVLSESLHEVSLVDLVDRSIAVDCVMEVKQFTKASDFL